jgi:hypothetical protein
MTTSEKIFITKAITGKGNFKVAVKVFQKEISGQSFTNRLLWEKEAFVFVEGAWIEIDSFSEVSFTSRKMMDIFGAKRSTKVKCDFQEIYNYIQEVNASSSSVEDEKSNFTNLIHNL